MSVKISVYNQNGEVKNDIKLSSDIFDIKMSVELVHQAAVAQMGNERQVLAHTKGRSEVRGGGKKPWKQKGTGRARVGSTRSPIWIGGGVTFGPTKDRNFSKDINKKMKRKALFMVLTDRLVSNNFVVLEKPEIEEYKTKVIDKFLNSLEKKVLKENVDKSADVKNKKRSILFINVCGEDKTVKSFSNLKGVKSINVDNINILDLLKYRNIIITDKAIEKIENIYKK